MSAQLARRLAFTAIGMVAPFVVIVLIYIGYVAAGTLATARTAGTIAGLGLQAPVRIVRDARGIAHIRASSLHDAAFAQGYATGADRLFQIDLTRRFVLGTLSEMFGGLTMDADKAARVVDVRGIAAAEFAHLSATDRDTLQAYADGVNAAAAHESLPPEYRVLLFHFEPWKPTDSLAVGFALVLDLRDSWYDVIARDAVERELGPRATAALFSLSDPAYDTPTTGGAPAPEPPLPALAPRHAAPPLAWNGTNDHDVLGSNEWAAGVARTSTRRALLANDPHLARRIPEIWHVVDIEAPGEHVAGTAVAGVPGVILGHNERLAWGTTNADVVSARVFRETFLHVDGLQYYANGRAVAASVRHETFNDRFGSAQTRDYLTTRHGFVLDESGTERYAVQWTITPDSPSPIAAFLALDRATSIETAMRALATYVGPTQNFTLAQTDGRVAYAMAGAIPRDPAWGLTVADGARTPAQPLALVPFAQLPHVAPSRTALLNNSNNLPYGAGYPYRLSAYFSAPYRAAEIARKLRALPKVDVAASHMIQLDTTSLPEAELARMCVAALRAKHLTNDADLGPIYTVLAAFDGRFNGDSRAATVIQRVRFVATRDLFAAHLLPATANAYLSDGPAFVTLMRALRTRPAGWFAHDDAAAFLVTAMREAIPLFGGRAALMTPYAKAYAVIAEHPLTALHLTFWNAPPFPGMGGSYAPAVQAISLGQSFRAVWDVGNWDAGGITLPLGESGEPGSPHYTDQVPAWLAGELIPLPFSDAALEKASTATLTLTP